MKWFKLEYVFAAEDADAAVEITKKIDFVDPAVVDSMTLTEVHPTAFEFTDEPTTGFVCDDCHHWFPEPQHQCLAGLRA